MVDYQQIVENLKQKLNPESLKILEECEKQSELQAAKSSQQELTNLVIRSLRERVGLSIDKMRNGYIKGVYLSIDCDEDGDPTEHTFYNLSLEEAVAAIAEGLNTWFADLVPKKR